MINKITRALLGLSLTCCAVAESNAQISFGLPANTTPAQVSGAEYFFGSDPGLGNGTFVPATPGNMLQIQPSVSINGLANGHYKWSVRVKNTLGNWSHTMQSYVNIYTLMTSLPGLAGTSTLAAAEYFTDTDPGLGNGIPLTLNHQDTANNIAIAVNITGLSNGIHHVFIRAKDDNNRWSQTTAGKFSILVMNLASLPANPPTDSVRKIEYFFNQDPGFGNGTILTVPATQNLQQFNIAANVSGLPEGTHTFYIRTLDRRSMTQATTFYKGTPLAVRWITCAAQFINDYVTIDWKIKQEASCRNYILERSNDGIRFGAIDSVTADEGESGAVFHYQARDIHPLPGRAYYRIRQQSTEGKYDYSMILGVFNPENAAIYSINNPVTSELKIRFNKEPDGKGVFFVTNMSGTRVMQFHTNGNRELVVHTAQLAPGTYLLHYQGVQATGPLRFIKL